MKIISPASPTLPAAHLTPERLEMRDSVRSFVADVVLPAANRLDPEHGEIPDEIKAAMADMGLFALLIPEEYGGLGLGTFEYCMVAEELSRGWMSVASLMARGNAFAAGLSDAQKKTFLPRVAAGEMLGAFAMSEPNAGSDITGVRTRAVLEGDEYVLTGQKMWCTYADRADMLIIVARTSPYDPSHPHEGLRNFFVLKEPGTFPEGVSGSPMRKIGYFGWKTWELSIDGLRIPADQMLGQDTAATSSFKEIGAMLTTARIHTAARSIGLARGALEDAVAYAQQREQFGQPIARFQALRFKMAHMAAEIEACRALMYQAAADADAGRAAEYEASMVKYLAAEMSERVTSHALQIHGGGGYTTDFAVERHWRDSRLTKIFEGTSEIQLKIISDRLLGR